MAESRAPARPQYKRSLKNYLIDSRFQLKYTSFILGVTLVISIFLGAFLWTTSNSVVTQSEKVASESKKVSDILKMQVKNDPVYSGDPELGAAISGASASSDVEVRRQQDALVSQQRTMMMAVIGGLALMVLLVSMLGIYATHKIAGPMYKMKLLYKQIGEGKLNVQSRLRKGDELQEFFEAFAQMVERLRARQEDRANRLTEVLERAKLRNSDSVLIEELELLRDEMDQQTDVAGNLSRPPKAMSQRPVSSG